MPKKQKISLISWNVNGIRAIERKDSFHTISDGKYDVVCLQETKISNPEQCSEKIVYPDGYNSYWNSSVEKKGYSGVVTYTKQKPLSVKTNFGKNNLLSLEGRVLETEFENFTLLNVYFPNGGSGSIRLKYKLDFYAEFLSYIKKKQKNGENIIFTGDVNTAHTEIDLARPKENMNSSGFMQIERDWIDKFVAAGFIDSFRYFYPNKKEAYSWWDMKTGARARNIGWRIDYFFIDKSLQKNLKKAFILPDVTGSDHCPVGIEIEI